jgi:two-component system, response regulator YesN
MHNPMRIRKREHIWQSRTFRFWFISYILILLVPTLFSVSVYKYTADTLEQRTYDAGQMSIRQVCNVVDERLAQICSVSDNIYLSSNISRIRYLTLPFTGAKYYELHNRAHYLRSFTAQHNLIQYIYVYYRDMDCLLEADHIYTELNQLDKVITQRIGLSREAFDSLMQQTYLHKFLILDNEQSIVYLRTLDSRDYGKTPTITLIIVLNTDSINALLADTSTNSLGSAYILQSNNSACGQFGNSDPLEYQQASVQSGVINSHATGNVVAYDDSNITDFRYVLSVPYASFFRNLNTMHLTFFFCLVVMLILGILITYALVRKNYKPLRLLKQTAHVTEKGKDDFDVLSHKLSELMTSEEKMYEAVGRLNEIADAQLLHSLLIGDFNSLGKSQIEQFYSSFTGNLFVVALIHLDDCAKNKQILQDMKGTDALSVLLNKLMADVCRGACEFVIRQDGEPYAAVFCFADGVNPNEAQVTARDNVTKLLQRLTQHLSLTASVCMGDARPGIGGIHASCTNAIRAQEYAAFIAETDNCVVMFDESMFSTNVAWREYDIVDAERRFASLMLEGNYSSGEQVLHEILAYYSCKDGMSLYVMRCRMFGVMNMMLNVLHEAEPDIDALFYEETSPVEQLLSARTMKELEEAVFHIINHLIGHQECKTTDIKGKLIQVEQYVAAHYFEWGMSVQQIADNFGLSLPYLSRMFKKEMGVGLLDYINHYRVHKAMEIIGADESMTLSEVAEAVGYNSSQTFIRIFKRYEGITPGTYRISQEERRERAGSVTEA